MPEPKASPGSEERIGAYRIEKLLGRGGKYHDTVNAFKKRLILSAIDQAGGNIARAAEILDLNPTYLHRLIRNFGLKDQSRSLCQQKPAPVVGAGPLPPTGGGSTRPVPARFLRSFYILRPF